MYHREFAESPVENSCRA